MPVVGEAVAMLGESLEKLMRLVAQLVREDGGASAAAVSSGAGNSTAEVLDEQLPGSVLQSLVTTGLLYHFRPLQPGGQIPVAYCVCPNCQRVVCVLPPDALASGFYDRGKLCYN